MAYFPIVVDDGKYVLDRGQLYQLLLGRNIFPERLFLPIDKYVRVFSEMV